MYKNMTRSKGCVLTV